MPNSQRRRILVVEDDPSSLDFLKTLLSQSGYEVVTAMNGGEALARAKDSPPDIVVTDVLMPIMDGFELAQKIRTDPILANLPILFYSATYHQNQAQWLTEACGVTDRLNKPADPEVILAAVEKALHAPVSGLKADPYLLAEEHVRVLSDKVARKVAQLTEHQKKLEAEITRREHLEAELRRSEFRYRTLIEQLPLGVFRCNETADRFETVNSALAGMLGYATPDEVLLLSLANDIFRDCKDLDDIKALPARKDGKGTKEAYWKRRGGDAILVRLSCRYFASESHVEGIAEDITLQRELEKQARQNQKLEALGRLAGGVAHDFNNLLMAIGGYTDLLLEDLPKDMEQRADVVEIRKITKRGAGVVRQLLAFSRKQDLELRVLDLNELATDMGKMLRHLLGSHIDLDIQSSDGRAMVEADRSQLEQVLLNLAVNARDAMPNGGKLLLQVSSIDLREDRRLPPGNYVCLQAVDTGEGIEPVLLDKVFEPFFTTKGDKGTGLGLATVYGIVKQSGGDIRVESRTGEGTTFTVLLPATDKPIAEPEALTPERARGDNELILLVEDEDAIRATTHDYLEMKGFRVIDAKDGNEGLQVLKERFREIAIVISDITMPSVTGIELAGVVHEMSPRTPVLLISGFVDSSMKERLRHLPAGTGYIEKPFAFETLVQRVRASLGHTCPQANHFSR